jgi:small subunit ribosomal protein S20
MPQHKSAMKRVRQDELKRARNRVQRSKMRTMVKKLQKSEDKNEAVVLLNDVKSFMDRLVSKNIIKKNQAANYKSSLEKTVNSLS